MKWALFFGGSWDMSKNWLKHKIKPPNQVCPNPWYTQYNFVRWVLICTKWWNGNMGFLSFPSCGSSSLDCKEKLSRFLEREIGQKFPQFFQRNTTIYLFGYKCIYFAWSKSLFYQLYLSCIGITYFSTIFFNVISQIMLSQMDDLNFTLSESQLDNFAIKTSLAIKHMLGVINLCCFLAR